MTGILGKVAAAADEGSTMLRDDRRGGSSGHRPIDLAHLARQTANDRALESEILDLLVEQIDLALQRLDAMGPGEGGEIAHALKGAARNVGAFPLADAAERFELEIGQPDALAALRHELAATAQFARTVRRG